MPDLRTLSLDQKRALSVEVERRARAGEAPTAIRAALGLSKQAYARWAKLFGFRQCDLYPDRPQACAPPRHPPGPGGYACSGRRFRGLPPGPDDQRFVYGPDHPAWRGGPEAWRQRDLDKRAARRNEAQDEVEGLTRTEAILTRVRAALDAGETTHADRLLVAWKRKLRRARLLAELEAEAAAEAARPKGEDEMTLDELAAEISRLCGETIRISGNYSSGSITLAEAKLEELAWETEGDEASDVECDADDGAAGF